MSEKSEKERQFVAEYEALLKKFNVCLVISKSSDEYGSYAVPSFKEAGTYCNINYIPDYSENNRGHRGMGG